ncbi:MULTISPECIES: hypothetical protein [Streptomyces]|uniref:Secreted protein n=1 Tax=Streptomyces siderophoricus TaxID=2802281 RepID=A0ABS1N1X9_9ACTN|nr:hypothetical protein [Streptomyces sp. 9-7]MBL1093945.1 hypothetical protein [Streptomyces sp. 9-7]
MSITTVRTRTALAAATLAMMGAAAATPAAYATPSAVTAHARGGTAPACIERNVYNHQEGGMDAYLRNLCGKTMRVKVIVDYWWDSGCHTMKNHTGWLYSTPGGRYRKTVVC